MDTRKPYSDSDIQKLLRSPPGEERTQKIIDLYEQADSTLAERIMSKVGWRNSIENIKHQKKNLLELFLIKSLSDKSPAEQLQSLVAHGNKVAENVCIQFLLTNRE